MNETSSKGTGAMLIAAVFGLIALLVSYGIFDFGFFWSLVVGILVAIIVWIVLWLGWGNGSAQDMTAPTTTGSRSEAKPIASAAPLAGDIGATAAVEPKPDTTGDAEKPAEVKDSASAAKTAAPAAKTIGTKAKATKAPAKPAAKAKADTPKTAAKPKAEKTTAAKAPAKAASASAATATDEAKPETRSAPRAGGADDLKKISGVGPALEKTLNELGFYHFDQIATWKKAEIEWVDARLRFKGRITRDDWVKQAKALTKG